MAKVVLASEIAEIVFGLLVEPEKMGELCESSTYSCFLRDITEVVTSYCGCELGGDVDWKDGVASIVVVHNESSPDEFGGVFSPYNPNACVDASEKETGDFESLSAESVKSHRLAIAEILETAARKIREEMA